MWSNRRLFNSYRLMVMSCSLLLDKPGAVGQTQITPATRTQQALLESKMARSR